MTSIRAYLELAAVIIILGAFSYFAIHERRIGEQKIEASDRAAAAAIKKLTDAQTQHAQDLANQAEQAALHEQKTLDNYALTHPIGPVRLCTQDNSRAGLPKASTAVGRTPDPSPGPAAVPAVPQGPDIGPALVELLQSAQRLAVIDREWQQR